MEETTYKVLMYNGAYVDFIKLFDGIYSTKFPILYSSERTIEDIVEKFSKRCINNETIDALTKNINECELVEVKLTFVK